MEDAEVVAKLPVLFRTLQGEPLPPGKMDELIEFIRSRQPNTKGTLCIVAGQ